MAAFSYLWLDNLLFMYAIFYFGEWLRFLLPISIFVYLLVLFYILSLLIMLSMYIDAYALK